MDHDWCDYAHFCRVEQVLLNQKAPMCGAFAEPSSGLEPETPPYHALFFATGRKRRQPLFACFRGCGATPFCHRLPPVATTGLRKAPFFVA